MNLPFLGLIVSENLLIGEFGSGLSVLLAISAGICISAGRSPPERTTVRTRSFDAFSTAGEVEVAWVDATVGATYDDPMTANLMPAGWPG